ncbi:hypothetical protein PFISCL1PPCAC_1932 [Pristionchus fissidentatus]|uniref:Uncharacterized protein n=1 Tax=Pristionchus fissidentatus TaxID=1538716 RepID=A0AAV5UYM9_9BILA|nr:hypothetical protein PFISCL1PPCAC_1932 [Pristionchus fissidentatus]
MNRMMKKKREKNKKRKMKEDRSVQKEMKEEEKEDSESEVEERRKIKKEKKRMNMEMECESRDEGWTEDEGMIIEEDEEEENRPSSFTNSTITEFRSNLIDLSRNSWNKLMKEYGIENEPSVRDRSKMARLIISHLKDSYGDELNKALQYYTLHSFSPEDLTEEEEVIGLVLYLDRRKLIADSFFFLILALNDSSAARKALSASRNCCGKQMDAVKIGRSLSLGKSIEREWHMALKEASIARRDLEGKYFNLFESILNRDSLRVSSWNGARKDKKIHDLKSRRFRNKRFQKAECSYGITSTWSAFDAYNASVRVFVKIESIFGGDLIPLLRKMNRASQSMDSIRFDGAFLRDASTGQALTALNLLIESHFLTARLLFLLLRFRVC